MYSIDRKKLNWNELILRNSRLIASFHLCTTRPSKSPHICLSKINTGISVNMLLCDTVINDKSTDKLVVRVYGPYRRKTFFMITIVLPSLLILRYFRCVISSVQYSWSCHKVYKVAWVPVNFKTLWNSLGKVLSLTIALNIEI